MGKIEKGTCAAVRFEVQGIVNGKPRIVAAHVNLLWIAGISVFVLLEKALPLGRVGSLGSALALVASGVVALARGL